MPLQVLLKASFGPVVRRCLSLVCIRRTISGESELGCRTTPIVRVALLPQWQLSWCLLVALPIAVRLWMQIIRLLRLSMGQLTMVAVASVCRLECIKTLELFRASIFVFRSIPPALTVLCIRKTDSLQVVSPR